MNNLETLPLNPSRPTLFGEDIDACACPSTSPMKGREGSALRNYNYKLNKLLGTQGPSSLSPFNYEPLVEPALCDPTGPAAVQRVHPPDGADVLRSPVRWLARLPAPSSLIAAFSGCEAPVVITTLKSAYTGALAIRKPAFSPGEYEVLCEAAERGYAFRRDLARWVELKRSRPRWMLNRREAFGGATEPPRAEPQDAWWAGDRQCPAHEMRGGWTWGRLFAHFGLRLLSAEVHLEKA